MIAPARAKAAKKAKQNRIANASSPDDFSDPIAWIEKNFYIGENEPFTFHPTQAEPLREALRRYPNGEFVYPTVVWSWPKKSAKTTIAAAVFFYKAMATKNGRFYLVGNKLDQADSRVGGYIQDSLKFNPIPGIKSIRNEITFPNGSVIRSVPVNPAGEAGSNPHGISYTELWGYTDNLKKHTKMFSEMTLSPNVPGQVFIDTYAGFEGESVILESLYESGKKGNKLSAESMGGNDFVYADKAAGLFMVWVESTHYLPWQQNQRYYDSERTKLLDSEFNRMHNNIWGRSVAVFIDPEKWDACKGEVKDPGRAWVVLGVDAGVKSDNFSLVGVWCDRSQGEATYHVFYFKAWEPPAGGGEIDFSEPEAEIKRLAKLYNVGELAYDPYQLVHMAQRLRRGNIVRAKEFTQGSNRLSADTALRNDIRDGRIIHSGDKTLGSHVKNANAKLTGDEENRLRLVKRNPKMKIDGAVALSMARHRAASLGI